MVEKIKVEMKAEAKAETKAEKPKKRATASAENDEEPVRSKKPSSQSSGAVRSEKSLEKTGTESKLERTSSPEPAASKAKSKNVFDGEPSSLPPDDTLRKLFNPHG
jgi:hypothetical protein